MQFNIVILIEGKFL